MYVSKEEIYILYKYDFLLGDNAVKGIYKSLQNAKNFKSYLEKRNRIKDAKYEEISKYTIERKRIYINLEL